MTWSLEDRTLRSVLVARLRYLGDVAMSTVVVDVLRRGDPDLDIGFLCESSHAPLLAGHPLIDRVHALGIERRGSDAAARSQSGPGAGLGTLGLVRQLRRRRYDLCVDLFFNPRSAVLLRFSGAPLRIGGARSWRRRLYTHICAAPTPGANPRFDELAPGGLGAHLGRLKPLRHEESGLGFLDWFLREYAGEGPATSVAAPALDESASQALLELDSNDDGDFILLAPGATWPAKEWSETAWRELIGILLESGYRVALLRSPGDDRSWGEFAAAIPTGRGALVGPLPLSSAMALTARAKGVVSVDGGLMHAAVALGRPTLALFGPTSPDIWFPYEGRGPFRVLASRPDCHPCNRRVCDEFVCMPDLKAVDVASALDELLRRTTT